MSIIWVPLLGAKDLLAQANLTVAANKRRKKRDSYCRPMYIAIQTTVEALNLKISISFDVYVCDITTSPNISQF